MAALTAARLLGLALALFVATLPTSSRAASDEAARITPSNPTPVIGVDDEVELIIRAPIAMATAPPRVVTSVGRIDGVSRLSANEFAARLILPDTRFPQVAMIAAHFSDPGVALGFLALRLRALTSLSFRTDPDAQVTLFLGDRELGPQAPDAQGEVTFAVAVPPGISVAKARSQNLHGKITEQTVELDPPPFPQLLIVAPEKLAAGRTTIVTVFVVDEKGDPAEARLIRTTTSNGRAHPLGSAPGQERFLVRAPGAVDINHLTVTAKLHSAESAPSPTRAVASAVEIALTPGPPASLELRPDRPRLPLGSGISMWVMVAARDLFGNPTPATGVELFADGERASVHLLADAQLAGSIPAPPRYTGRASIEIDAVLAGLHASVQVPLSNIPPLRVAAKIPVRDAPQFTVAPRGALLLHGPSTAGGGVVVDAHARRKSWPDRFLVGVRAGYLRTHFPAQDGFGRGDIRLQQIPILATLRARIHSVPRFELAATGGFGISLGRLNHQTATWEIKRNLVGLAGVVGIEAGGWWGSGMMILGAHYLYMGYPSSTGQDGVMGNAGGIVFDMGYRFGR